MTVLECLADIITHISFSSTYKHVQFLCVDILQMYTMHVIYVFTLGACLQF